MNRNFIGGLLAGFFTSIAIAGQAQPARNPSAELALGFIPAVLSQQGAPSGSNARKQAPPSCGCIPRPRKNCPDRFCDPT